MDNGGIAEHLDPSAIWFEKFAHPENERPKILNGHLFAVIGLFDLADRTGRNHIRTLAEKGLEAARLLMPKFDLGGWTGYSIHGKPASQHYHDVVVEQLSLLSPHADWVQTWHDKFKGYRFSKKLRKAWKSQRAKAGSAPG